MQAAAAVGKVNSQTPSRFLNDIPEEFLAETSKSVLQVDQKSDFPPGTIVYHDDYGSGQVIKEWDNGKEVLIIVRFESGRTAQFIPKYSGLEKIALDNEW